MRNHSDVGAINNLTVNTFITRNNSFTTLPLDFDSLKSLYIQDNPNLTTLLYHAGFDKYN
jgi:hypothetical protein